MRIQRVLWAGVLCGCQTPAVTSAGPDVGPYGTVITIEGQNLNLEGGRIVFDDGLVVAKASMLSVSDSKVEFRAPSPARGAYRWVGDGESLDAGRFEPDPWRPLSLAADSTGYAPLDFALLGPGSVVELRHEQQQLVVRFHDGETITDVSSPNAGRPAAGVIWAEGADGIGAFVLEPEPAPVLRALDVDRSEARDVSIELPEDARELLGFDRVDGHRYAFVADSDEQEVLKYEWTADGLEEVAVVADPVDRASDNRRFAARGGHAWRVWAETVATIFDQTFTVRAAYLGADAGEFEPEIQIGTGDDSASYLEVVGVTDQGELAVEFCGTDGDIGASTVTTCQSVLVTSAGVSETTSSLKGEARRAFVPLGSELQTLECTELVQHLIGATGDSADSLLSPCADRVPRYRLSPTNAPGFLVKSADGYVVLTRRE
jgi:hypothetical protein